jgi:hypothetical protein
VYTERLKSKTDVELEKLKEKQAIKECDSSPD